MYIGRGTGQLKKSPWSNPFTVRRFGRSRALELYNNMVQKSACLKARLPELADKVLRCHCRPCDSCHADTLVQLYSQSSGSSTVSRVKFVRKKEKQKQSRIQFLAPSTLVPPELFLMKLWRQLKQFLPTRGVFLESSSS